jgi:2-phosphosulfolactate phosphatase
MKINILSFIKGAQQARGLTVIIDVFRAWSVACYVFGNGAGSIIPVGAIDRAYRLKKEHPTFVLMGEREGKKPRGFDYGNSPTEIETVDFTNKTIIQTTSAGTQGIVNATNADEILTGSFVNAQAIITYINMQKPKEVSLVVMGSSGIRRAEEDTLCAQYIKNALKDTPNDFLKIVEHLKQSSSSQRFFDPAKNWVPKRDFTLCLSLNKFDFVLKSETDEKDQIILRKIQL